MQLSKIVIGCKYFEENCWLYMAEIKIYSNIMIRLLIDIKFIKHWKENFDEIYWANKNMDITAKQPLFCFFS